MGRDKKARAHGRVTVLALANLIASIVDAMRSANVPNDVTLQFLERLDQLNGMTLSGAPGQIMADVVHVIRCSVPSND